MNIVPNPEVLTLGDLKYLEDECGKTFTEVFNDMAEGKVSAYALAALAVIQERRGNAAFTMAMADRLSMDDIDFDVEGNGSPKAEGSGGT